MDVNKTDEISEVRLLNEKIEPFKQLNGYQKHHRVPQAFSENDLRFLATLTQSDLDADLQDKFSRLRSAFEFKRKEISVSGPDDGAGVIITPYFNYEILVAQADDDPTQVAWRRSISAIRQPEQIFGDSFRQTFGNQFSILEVSTVRPLDLESIVDHVEDAGLDSVSVNYDKDVSWCKIHVVQSLASVLLRPNSIRVSSRQEISPRQLVESFLDIQRKFMETLDCAGNSFLMDVK